MHEGNIRHHFPNLCVGVIGRNYPTVDDVLKLFGVWLTEVDTAQGMSSTISAGVSCYGLILLSLCVRQHII